MQQYLPETKNNIWINSNKKEIAGKNNNFLSKVASEYIATPRIFSKNKAKNKAKKTAINSLDYTGPRPYLLKTENTGMQIFTLGVTKNISVNLAREKLKRWWHY